MTDEGTSSVFQAELEKVLDRIPGGLSATLVDVDGISLASYSADNSLNADIVAAELASMVKSMRRVFESLRTGSLQEFLFTTDEAVIVTRPALVLGVLAVVARAALAGPSDDARALPAQEPPT